VSKIYNIAIVGAGIGERQASGLVRLQDKFRIAVICDRNLERAGKLGDQIAASGAPRPDVMGEFGDELFMRTDIDIVSICLPPFLHFDATKRSLEAGKHTVCEKPLVGSLAEVDMLETLAKASGRTLMPVFQYRFGKGLQKAHHLIRAGAAGKIYTASIETHWTRGMDYYAVPWRGKLATELGGALLGHSIHIHDILTELIGPIASVSALTAVRVNPIETEDCAAVIFEMANGALVTSSTTLGSADELTRFRLACENVTMICNPSPYTPDRDPWTFIPKAPKDEAFLAAALKDAPDEAEGYTGQYARYHSALEGGGELPVTVADAYRSIELATAMYLSAHTGERVRLPISKEHPAYGGWRH
jgi:predicted dehydrogenase